MTLFRTGRLKQSNALSGWQDSTAQKHNVNAELAKTGNAQARFYCNNGGKIDMSSIKKKMGPAASTQMGPKFNSSNGPMQRSNTFGNQTPVE